MSFLSVRGLKYDYPDGTTALRGVDFSLEAGERVAVVGSNGSGKSTLLLHLSGCIPVAAGEIFLNEEAVGNKSDMLRKRVGMIFQNPDDQLFMPSVAEDVAFGPLAAGEGRERAERLALAVLEDFGIAHLANRAPHRLSGGEKRMVAICGILVMNPELVLLDEPSSSLDPASRARLIDALERMDRSMMIATHDIDLALELCERALVLHGGIIVADGQTRDLLNDENLMRRTGLKLGR